MQSEYFEKVKRVNIENWPNLLFNESMATYFFQLTEEERNALILAHPMTDMRDKKNEFGLSNEQVDQIISRLENKITEQIKRFPNGVFVKLGSRSPKDSWLGYKKGFTCFDGAKVILLFCDSERIYEDLYGAKNNNYLPFIVLREWIEIPKWAEFRGFVKESRLVALSQYNYLEREAFPEIVENASSIQWAIERKFERIADLLTEPDVIVDFFVRIKKKGNENICEVKVVELNPFDHWTDPCLFNWSRDDFSNFESLEFRYFKVSEKKKRSSLSLLAKEKDEDSLDSLIE